MTDKKRVLYKYYQYPQTNRITSRMGKCPVTGKGMILRMPMSPDEMDLQIEKSLR